ncbi:MAG: prenyltransferase [Pseudomonadota bacterium]
MIFVPLLIGQTLAFHVHGQFSWSLFLSVALFGVLYQVHLLYLNDYADAAIDQTNQQYWLSGGSRVVPQGKLQADDLLVGAKVALLLMLVWTLIFALFLDRWLVIVGVALVVAASWAYNLRPLRLSYRGHGEVLQGFGCGVVLPLIGFYVQHGTLGGFRWAILAPLYLLFHAGNIITALPDYPSDRKGGKRTLPVRHGELPARLTALLLLALAYFSVVAESGHVSPIYLAIVVLPAACILVGVVTSGLLRRADAADVVTCKAFVTWMAVSQGWFLCVLPVVLLLDGAA